MVVAVADYRQTKAASLPPSAKRREGRLAWTASIQIRFWHASEIVIENGPLIQAQELEQWGEQFQYVLR
jgi:hypothetical protein